jgi:hypothetical protein
MVDIGIIDGSLVKIGAGGEGGYYREYYFDAVADLKPTFISPIDLDPSAATIGGWRMQGAGIRLGRRFTVGDDWDGISNIEFILGCEANAAGSPGDQVTFTPTIYTKEEGDTTSTVTILTNAVEVVGTIASNEKFQIGGTIGQTYLAKGMSFFLELEYNNGLSDIPVIFNYVIMRYKTKYPNLEV